MNLASLMDVNSSQMPTRLTLAFVSANSSVFQHDHCQQAGYWSLIDGEYLLHSHVTPDP